MKLIRMVLVVVALLASVDVEAKRSFSADVSALSSSQTRQVLAAGQYTSTAKYHDYTTSGRYIRSEGRDEQYDYGAALTVKPGFFRVVGDFREFHTHRTAGGSFGAGFGPLTVSGGLRSDWAKPDYDRNLATTLGASFKRVFKDVFDVDMTITASAEYLRFGVDDDRLDFRLRDDIHIKGRFYVFVVVDRLRGEEVQSGGVSLKF